MRVPQLITKGAARSAVLTEASTLTPLRGARHGHFSGAKAGARTGWVTSSRDLATDQDATRHRSGDRYVRTARPFNSLAVTTKFVAVFIFKADFDAAPRPIPIAESRATVHIFIIALRPPAIPDFNELHRSHALSDLNMLRGPGGRERTEAQYRDLLGETGFHVTSVTAAGRFAAIEASPAAG